MCSDGRILCQVKQGQMGRFPTVALDFSSSTCVLFIVAQLLYFLKKKKKRQKGKMTCCLLTCGGLLFHCGFAQCDVARQEKWEKLNF